MRRNLAFLVRDINVLGRGSDALAQRWVALGSTMMAAGTGMMVAGGAGMAAIAGMTVETARFNRELALASTQVDDTRITLERIGRVARDTAFDIPGDMDRLPELLFDIFSVLHPELEQVQGMTEQFFKAAVAGQADLQAVSRVTMQVLNAFYNNFQEGSATMGIQVEDVTRVLDMQFRMVQRGTGTYDELSGALTKVIPAAQGAGQSVETMMGSVAFLTRMGVPAEMAGTSVARAMEVIARSGDRLEDMGIQVQDASGEFLQINEIVTNMAHEWQDLSTPELFQALDAAFAGQGWRIQARRFFQLAVPNFQILNALIEDIALSSGDMERAFEIMADEPALQMELLAQQFRVIRQEIGTEFLPHLRAVIDAGQDLTAWIREFNQTGGVSIGRIIAITSAVIGLSGAITALAGAYLLFSGMAAMANSSIAKVLRTTLLWSSGIGLAVGALTLLIVHSETARDVLMTFLAGLEHLVFEADRVTQTLMAVGAAAVIFRRQFTTAVTAVMGYIGNIREGFRGLQDSYRNNAEEQARNTRMQTAHAQDMQRLHEASVRTIQNRIDGERRAFETARHNISSHRRTIEDSQRAIERAHNEAFRSLADRNHRIQAIEQETANVRVRNAARIEDVSRQTHFTEQRRSADIRNIRAETARVEEQNAQRIARVREESNASITRNANVIYRAGQDIDRANAGIARSENEAAEASRRATEQRAALRTANQGYNASLATVEQSVTRLTPVTRTLTTAKTALAVASRSAGTALNFLGQGIRTLLGPANVVIGVIMAIVYAFGRARQAAREFEQASSTLADQLEEVGGVIEDLDRGTVLDNLGQDVQDAAREVGIGMDLLTDASLGNEAALERFNRKAEESQGVLYNLRLGHEQANSAISTITLGISDLLPGLSEEESAWRTVTEAIGLHNETIDRSLQLLQNRVEAEHGAVDSHNSYSAALREGNDAQEATRIAIIEILAEANELEEMWDDLDPATRELAAGMEHLEEGADGVGDEFEQLTPLAEGLGQAFEDIHDPLGAVNELMQEQELTIGSLIESLQEQESNFQDFAENLIWASATLSSEFVENIMELGPSAPAALAAAREGSESELEELERLLGVGAHRTSEEFVGGIEQGLNDLPETLEIIGDDAFESLMKSFREGDIDLDELFDELDKLKEERLSWDDDKLSKYGISQNITREIDENKPQFEGSIGGVESRLLGAGQTIEEVNEGIGQSLQDTGSSVGEWARNVGESISSWVDNARERMSNWASDTGESIGNWVRDTGEGIGEWARNTRQSMSDWATNVGTSISNGAERVRDFFDSVVETTQPFRQWVTDIIAGTNNLASGVASGVGNFVSVLTEPIRDALSESWTNFENFWRNVGERTREGVSSVSSSIGDAVSGWWGNLRDFWQGTGSDIRSWVTDTAQEFTGWAARTAVRFSNWRQGVSQDISEWASDTGSAIATWVSDNWGEFREWWQGVGEGFREWFNDTNSRTNDWSDDTSSTIREWVSDTWSEFGEWWQGVGAEFRDWFTDNRDRFRDWWQEIGEGIRDWVSTSASRFRNFSETASEHIEVFGTIAGRALRNFLATSATRIGTWISDRLQAFRDFWSDVREGFSDLWSSLTTGARNGLSRVFGAVRSGINSIIGGINTLIRGFNRVAELVNLDVSINEIGEIGSGGGGGFRSASGARHKGGPVDGSKGDREGRTGPLRPDEQMIIAKRGEYVINNDDVKRMGGIKEVRRKLDKFGTLETHERGQGPGRGRGAPTWGTLVRLIRGSGLPHRVTSTVRSGGGASYHNTGHAIDMAGSVPYPAGNSIAQMRAINRWIASNYGGSAAELIWTGPGAVNLRHGRPHTYNAGVRAQHRNHVHWASTGVTPGGSMDGAGADGGGFWSNIWSILSPVVSRARSAIDAVTDFGPVGDLGRNLGRQLLEALPDFLTSFGGSDDGSSYSGPLRGIMESIARGRGWESHIGAWANLIQRESSWNPTAQNPTSTAFGLGQFLNSTWAGTGIAKTSHPGQQLEAMARYIQSRYGSPSGAWSFWQRNRWYDNGGLLHKGLNVVAHGASKPDIVAAQGMIANEVGSALSEQGDSTLTPQDIKDGWVYQIEGRGHFLKVGRGEDARWYQATGLGQLAGIEELWGKAMRRPESHLGRVQGSVVDLFGGPGGIENVLAGHQPLPREAREGAQPLDRIHDLLEELRKSDATTQDVTSLLGALDAEIAQEQAIIGLERAKQAIIDIKGEIASLDAERDTLLTEIEREKERRGPTPAQELNILRQRRDVAEREMELEQMRSGQPTLEQELAVLNQRERVAEMEKELEQARSGQITPQQELNILNQRARVADLEETLSRMQNQEPDPEEVARAKERIADAERSHLDAINDSQQAMAELAYAQFDLVRSKEHAAVLRDSGDEVAALLMEYEAQYNLAKASDALNDAQEVEHETKKALKEAEEELEQIKKDAIVTDDELRIAELELMLARQQLDDLTNEHIYSTDELRKMEIELALALKELDNVTNDHIYSTEDLREKELELIIAKEGLKEAIEESQGPTEREIELRQRLEEVDELLIDKEGELRDAVDNVADAKRESINATINLINATEELGAVTPEALGFFEKIAKAAGVTRTELTRVSREMRSIREQTPAIKGAQESGAKFYESGGDYYLRTSSGRWYHATGPGQIAALKKFFGQPRSVPSNHIGRIRGAVVDLFGGPNRMEEILAGERDFPKLAQGGIVKRRPGGTPVVLGEGRHDEAVIPLKGNNTGPSINIKFEAGSIVIEGDADEDKVRRAINEALDEQMTELHDTLSQYRT